MTKHLVFATNNRHKLEEVAAQTGADFQLHTLNDIGCNADIDETGATFRENASLKSWFIYNNYGLDCFADDSGLEVAALHGAPGVYSARYAGMHGNHAANIDKVLQALKENQNRRARFSTVISLIWKGHEHFFEGTVEGVILYQCAGAGGFGYDPIFRPDGYNITFAEMTLEDKNAISHRAKAVKKMVDFLKTI